LPPAITSSEIKLDLPCTETLWNISEEAKWKESVVPTPLFQGARNALLRDEEVPQYSVFGGRIMMTALFLDIWSLRHIESPGADQSLRDSFEIALQKWCRSMQTCPPESNVLSLSPAPHQGHHPLEFNAFALFRQAHARLFVDLCNVQETLRYCEEAEIAKAMSLAAKRIERTSDTTKAVWQTFRMFQIPAKNGINLTAKTAALNWSVEHVLCGFDCALLLALWLYRIEQELESNPPDEDERSLLNSMRELLEEVDREYDASQSLAVWTAQVWGEMCSETVVWGVTSLCGGAFKMLADQMRNGVFF